METAVGDKQGISEWIRQKHNLYLMYTTAIGCLGGFLFGYDLGVISPALLLIPNDIPLTVAQKGFVVSIILFGAIIGSLISGYISDRIGRKYTVFVSSTIFLVGSFTASLAINFPMLVGGRVVLGVGVGVCSMIIPVYISELSPAHLRGMLISINELFITLGIFLSILVGIPCSEIKYGWRIMFVLASVPAFIQAVGIVFLPESPRWLLQNNMKKSALLALQTVRENNEIATQELQDIENDILAVKENMGTLLSISEIFLPDYYRSMMVGVGIVIFQQITGQPTIVSYSSVIFKIDNNSVKKAVGYATASGFVKMAATGLSIAFADRWGRRPLLLFGSSLMSSQLAVMAIPFLFPYITENGYDWISLIGMMAYYAAYSFSFGPIGWILISEIFPLRIRGVAVSFCVTLNWATQLLVSMTFPFIVNQFGMGFVLLLYAVIGIFAFTFIYFVVPETKGKTLEEMDTIFNPS